MVTFLLIIIPIFILAFYIYGWGINVIKNEISKSTNAQASYYIEGLEKEIERIKILQYDCLNDDNLNKLAIRYEVMDMYSITEALMQLQQRLVTIKNSSVYVNNVSVHILPIEKSVSSNTGVDPIDMKRYQSIRVPRELKGVQIIRYDNGLFLSTFSQSTSNVRNPLFLIEIELDQNALKQALTQLNIYEGSGSVLISNTNKDVIINSYYAQGTDVISKIMDKLNEEDMNVQQINIGKTGYYVVQVQSDYLNMILLKYIPKEHILKPIKNFYVWAWIFSAAFFAITVIYSYSTYRLMHKPLRRLVRSFKMVESGNLQVSISHNYNDEFGYLYNRFNEMVSNLNTLIDQVYNQKILMQKAELKQLQSQINPHFLYNSLFMINTMATVGDDNLIPFTRYLGEYFRFITRNKSDYLPLSEEVKHAKVYTEIQMMRFSSRIEVVFGECPERFNNIIVPRLILQPIIENAFEHGLESKMSGGMLSISFFEKRDELDIIIADNGSEVLDENLTQLSNLLANSDDEVEITGIINIHRRIQLVFGKRSGLSVSRSTLGGLQVVMKIIDIGGSKSVQVTDC